MQNKQKIYFKIIWSRQFLAVTVNQVYEDKVIVPLTNSWYFWPDNSGWEFLYQDLENKPLLTDSLKKTALNQYTELINYWKKNSNQKITKQKIENECLPIQVNCIGCR